MYGPKQLFLTKEPVNPEMGLLACEVVLQMTNLCIL